MKIIKIISSPFIKKCEFGIQMNTDAAMLKYGTIFV